MYLPTFSSFSKVYNCLTYKIIEYIYDNTLTTNIYLAMQIESLGLLTGSYPVNQISFCDNIDFSSGICVAILKANTDDKAETPLNHAS